MLASEVELPLLPPLLPEENKLAKETSAQLAVVVAPAVTVKLSLRQMRSPVPGPLCAPLAVTS